MIENAHEFQQQILRGQEAVLAGLENMARDLRSKESVAEKLNGLQDQVLAHLQFQSRRVMPLLEQAWAADREKTKQLEYLAFESRELKLTTVTFFDHYVGVLNSAARRNFPREFMQYRQAVLDRIHAEEEYLLPLLTHSI